MTMGLHGWSRVDDNISKVEIEWTENQIIGRIIYMYIELGKNPDSSSIGEDNSDPVIKIEMRGGGLRGLLDDDLRYLTSNKDSLCDNISRLLYSMEILGVI